jgi:DNA primase
MAGRIVDGDVEEVRNRADIAEIAAQYMTLKRAGGGRFKALCPFHAEKTPSFTIDPAKGLFICFGCGKGGNVYNLVMELENLSFVETVEKLAGKVGVTLRYENLSPQEREASGKRQRMVAAHTEAVAYYHDRLLSNDGEEARAYLKQRGFTKPTAVRFQIGYAPKQRDALIKHLRAKGFGDKLLLEAGLARSGNDGVVDAFRNRLMFPIFDVAGDAVAFGGRILEGTGPKYINTAESPVWHKGKVLYALHLAKAAVVRDARAIVVEGYTDVIALHQAGIETAVASCGTALGLEHFKLLRRFTDRAILAYDADQAGQAAAARAFEEAFTFSQEAGIDTRVVELPPGSDPADHVARDKGAGFAKLIEGAVPVIEYRLRRELQRFDLSDAVQQDRALKATVPILRQSRDEVVRRQYARWLAARLRIDEDLIVPAIDADARAIADVSKASLKRMNTQAKTEREALQLALQYPSLVKPHADLVGEEDFSVRAHAAIWREARHGDVDVKALAQTLDDANARKAVAMLAMEEIHGEASDRRVVSIFAKLKELSLQRQIEEMKARLQKVNPLEREDEYQTLMQEWLALEGRRREIREWGEGS